MILFFCEVQIKNYYFHLIPYDQQYETRDSKYLVSKVSDKILQNRKNYIKEFNPYLKCNVSDNLDHSLKDFYMKRYVKSVFKIINTCN